MARSQSVRAGGASAEGHMGVHVQLYLYTHFGAENTSNGTRNGTRTNNTELLVLLRAKLLVLLRVEFHTCVLGHAASAERRAGAAAPDHVLISTVLSSTRTFVISHVNLVYADGYFDRHSIA